ncbi:hypothetical protein KJ359_006714 [Pestalotiopsis sp. 9143b]|nr:hypothetical protein KJ359_006714 [Pestalotiopsis sp. 9143b]
MADDSHGPAPEVQKSNALLLGFAYEPLAETDVRLIKIHPGIIGSPIVGEIAHVNLRTRPEFLALSYVWGSDAKTREIQLNGHKVNITQNLYVALDRLRTYCIDFARMWIWIDALCIDQQNTAEKSFQVGRMTEIYGQAHEVCAWLGESDSEKEADMKVLFDDFEFIRLYRESSPEEKAGRDDPALALLDWGANERLMELAVNPWFSRVWTLQEAVLSRSCRVYVGRHCTTLDAFLARSVDVHDRETYNSLRLVDLVRSEVRMWSSSVVEPVDEREMAQQLRLFLDCVRQRTSRVEHDAIYGVLGLWKLVRRAPLPTDLVPDYDMSYAAVCHAYMIYLLRNTGVLNFLNSYYNGLANERIPSWVSDFRYLLPAWEPTLGNTSTSISANDRTLTLTGYQAGLVRGATHCTFWSGDEHRDRNVWIQAIVALEREIVAPLANLRNVTADEARLQTTRKSQPVRAGKEEKQGKGHGYPKSCTCWCGCKSAAEGDSGKCKYCKEKKCHEKKKA